MDPETQRRRKDIGKMLSGLMPPSEAAQSQPEAARQAVLLGLHTSYVDRYHKDHDRAWSTAVWLVAIAWTLFPAAAAMGPSLTPDVILIFGAASVALVGLWLLIASLHVTWASRSYDMIRGIEIALLTPEVEGDVRTQITNAHKAPFGDRFEGAMSGLRILIFVGTAAAWIGMWWGVQAGSLTFPAN